MGLSWAKLRLIEKLYNNHRRRTRREASRCYQISMVSTEIAELAKATANQPKGESFADLTLFHYNRDECRGAERLRAVYNGCELRMVNGQRVRKKTTDKTTRGAWHV